MVSASLQQLDIFAQMIASGSAAACARELGVSVASVERDMAALEARLGYALFESSTGRTRLTEAGRKTVRAMTLLSDQTQGEWDAVDPAPPPAPPPEPPQPHDDRLQVTIAAPAPVFSHYQDALTAFEQANADVAITLDLTVQSAADATRMLARGTADIVYFYTLGEPTGMTSRYVWSEQLAIYLGAEHPLARADIVRLDDLAPLSALKTARGNGLRAIIDQALDQARLVPANVALETDNLFDIMTATRAGLGYFVAFGPLARDFGRMTGISRARLADPLPAIEVRQAVRTGETDRDGMIAALADYLFL
jgi:DNA-binding transcriptional LysR family regulator